MPFVTIRITDENVSKQEKRKLIVGVTDLLQNVLGKKPKTTHMIIEEVNTDNWGIAGEQVTELRKRAG